MAEERQTLLGLATWLASMDHPESSWRPHVTLDRIIDTAKEALATEKERAAERDRLQAALSALRRGVEAEIERLEDQSRRNHRLWSDAEERDVQKLAAAKGREQKIAADRLSALLPSSSSDPTNHPTKSDQGEGR
jgi:chromosome segregation ATPase